MAAHVLYGTLDLLVLHALRRGPLNGLDIVQTIRALSDDVLVVEDGSLYPALSRLELNGAIAGRRGSSYNNRRARYYKLTEEGRKILEEQQQNWKRLSGAVHLVLTR